MRQIFLKKDKKESTMPKKTIRYVAVGDSYTYGEGAEHDEAWPGLLVEHLGKNGVDIELVLNPAVSGWATGQAIEFELPELREAKPDFATVMLGANDIAQGAPLGAFREQYAHVLDEIQSVLRDKKNIVAITIPDFSATPAGKDIGEEMDAQPLIAAFNKAIKEEAAKRNLDVADVYPASREMESNKAQVSEDGLHPSAAGYKRWEGVI